MRGDAAALARVGMEAEQAATETVARVVDGALEAIFARALDVDCRSFASTWFSTVAAASAQPSSTRCACVSASS
jgi:hypothetical protein